MDISDTPARSAPRNSASPLFQRSELNGGPVEAEDFGALALFNYGHFTSMQVSDGRVRGLDLHMDRLKSATRELFATSLDVDRVRNWMRSIVDAEPGTFSLRVTVFSRAMRREATAEPALIDVLTTIAPPRGGDKTPMRLKSFRYERALPHVKHVGTFALFHHRRLAQREGFGDALFVDSQNRVSEASVWNIGFFDGSRVVWPNAPALKGISMQLLDEGLRSRGIKRASVNIGRAELGNYRSAFLTNSSCPVRPIAAIDGVDFVVDHDFTALLEESYAANPCQQI
ncbi:MAG TPA: aminotransferase class IV family protein [Rhodanobacteraceae bacterium]|jgi:branched-subunit amino acid aminotransferase/4-amino-4-deoxychorismate lyase|nr:aminotransferase class IV family protein [Rhodanobacteraceae bacterium]